MKKKIIQSFLVVFLIGLLVEGVVLFSRDDEAISVQPASDSDNEKESISSKEEKSSNEKKDSSIVDETSEESGKSSIIPDNYVFGRTLFQKEDVTMTVDSFKKGAFSAESYTFWMSLASNVFPEINKGQTTSDNYMISSENIKVVTDTGITLTGEELAVGAGNGHDTTIASRELEDKDASDVLLISYTFEAEEASEIQISLVDDQGNEMIISEWIELLNTTADIFTSPEIFSAFLISEGANQIEQYLFQQINDTNSSESKFKYIINFNTFAEDGMAPPGETYALSKDGKVFTYSIYENEGRDWRYSEEWTNKVANFDPEPWLWGEGIEEQVIASLTEEGYIEEDNYYFVPNKLVNDYSDAYDVVILDEEYGYNPINVVHVNNKTGDYHG